MDKRKKKIEDIFRLIYKHWKNSLPKIDEICPDEETLACFVDGLLDKNEEANIKDHLIRCARCMEAVVLAIKIRC